MEIEVELLPDAFDFIDSLDEKTQNKIYYYIQKTRHGERGDWFEKMAGTFDLWEFRILYNQQYVRMLAFWDKRKNRRPGLIVCTHGFLKTTAKTPYSEIERAIAIRARYFSCEN